MILHAIRGNAAYMREILDRVGGPVRPVSPEGERVICCYIPRGENPRDRDRHLEAEIHNGVTSAVD